MIEVDVTKIMDGYLKVEKLQQSAFPPEENYPMDELLALSQSEHIEYKSFWEKGSLMGLLFYNVGNTSIYLFYLAIEEAFRSKGYGKRLLEWLRENYPNKSVIANIEPIGQGAENEEQRVRRFSFYKKNGFKRLPFRIKDDTGIYDIISTKETFNQTEYMSLISDLGFDAFHPEIYKSVQDY